MLDGFAVKPRIEVQVMAQRLIIEVDFGDVFGFFHIPPDAEQQSQVLADLRVFSGFAAGPFEGSNRQVDFSVKCRRQGHVVQHRRIAGRQVKRLTVGLPGLSRRLPLTTK